MEGVVESIPLSALPDPEDVEDEGLMGERGSGVYSTTTVGLMGWGSW